jgi:hypothetical protein
VIHELDDGLRVRRVILEIELDVLSAHAAVGVDDLLRDLVLPPNRLTDEGGRTALRDDDRDMKRLIRT